jgi:amino acid adenylation domain-containing protein
VGKIDYRALEQEALNTTIPADHPQTPHAPDHPTLEILLDVWRSVLGRLHLDADDDFFALGGHSLLATRLVSRLREELGVELPLVAVFAPPDVAGLALKVEEIHARSLVPPLPPLVSGSAKLLAEQPLSFAQQRLWFLDQLGAGTAYNMFGAREFLGELNIAALKASLEGIVARHDVLRTRFPTVVGEPQQIVGPVMELEMPLIDLSSLDGGRCSAEAQRLARAEAHRPFDLAEGPLLRCTLLRLGTQEHRLLVAMHHIISDGWSLGVFHRELALHYQALVKGRRPELPALSVQYIDFAAWQREWLQGEALDSQLAYWSDLLGGGLPVLELPTDRPRPAVKNYRGAGHRFVLPVRLASSLRQLASNHGGTLAMALLSGFQTLLFRHTQQRDLVVGLPIANRTRSEIEDLIGFFVNTLAIRVGIRGDFESSDPSFSSLLDQVREVSLGAYAHQDLPFEELVRVLQPERALSHSPLFQVLFQLMNAPMEAPDLPGLKISPVPQRLETSIFDLSLMLWETPTGLAGRWRFNPGLFDATTMARLTMHYCALLEGAVADPSCSLGSLPLLSASERHQLCREWNDPTVGSDAARLRSGGPKLGVRDTVLVAFDHWVKASPEAEAVVFGGPGTENPRQSLTYGELARWAEDAAWQLRQAGVARGDRVGLCVRRSLDMVVGLLGILRVGAAYVPLDPTLPAQRLIYMLEVSKVALVLSQAPLAKKLAEVFSGREVLLCPRASSDDEVSAQRTLEKCSLESLERCHPPFARLVPEDLAYVIFTSGSTGRPKGVAMTHGPLANLIGWHLRTLLGGVRSLQFATLGFDGSFHEIFATWCSGGSLYLVPEDLPRDVVALRQLLEAAEIEKAKLPVVMLQQLAEEWVRMTTNGSRGGGSRGGRLSLRELTVSGSQLTITPAVAAFCAHHPKLAVHNHYGPSETHVAAAYPLPKNPTSWPLHLPIGQPISGVSVYLLDRTGEPVGLGVIGEIYLGGRCPARGYFARPGLTAERFVPDAGSGAFGGRLYRTGDLSRHLADGTLQFLGRADHQVKLRGFRIEPGEIETVAAEHGGVKRAMVTVGEDPSGESRLVLYAVCGAPPPSVGDLRSYMRQRLPEYMVPATIVFLDALPLTSSGKVDRAALPQADQAVAVSGISHSVPETPMQEEVVGLWREVLKIEDIGIHDNFFDLGGHSLRATRLVARVRHTMGVELPVRAVFEGPTVAEMELEITALLADDEEAEELAQMLSEIRGLSAEELDGLLEED